MSATYDNNTPTTIRIFGTVKESIVDGPGMRYAVFTQGCPHACRGCHNPESWDPAAGRIVRISDIVDEIDRNKLLSGITLTGGDPFNQPRQCSELIREIKTKRPELDVWAWSGWTFDELLHGGRSQRDMLSLIDVLVDGPFEEDSRTLSMLWRGSRNQRVIDVQSSLRNGTIVLHSDN